MATNSAASPIRRLVLTIRVYPPGRSLNRVATSPKSFDTTFLLLRKLNARRRAGKVPSLPSVIIRSVRPRISFAFASVVSIRSCSRRDVTKLLNNAQRCLVCRPSCLPFFLWRTSPSSFLLAFRTSGLSSCLDLDAQTQSHIRENFLDLVQRFFPEVFGLQHLSFSLLNQIRDGLNIRIF